MGLSSNQARFLSLTSRQVDLEQRIQQICQRRLRLSSELENVSTSYNNKISNRKMFTSSMSGINNISINSLSKIGYKVIDAQTKKMVQNIGVMNKPSAVDPVATQINSEQDFFDKIVNGGASALLGNYVLNCDIDLSSKPTFAKAVINGVFQGTFDGQGHTISGANIVAGSNDQSVGFFAQNNGNIKNLALSDMHITSSSDSTRADANNIGILVGNNVGNIDNVAVTDSNINLSNNYKMVGGLVGSLNGGHVFNSYSTTDVQVGNSARFISGLIGDINIGSVKASYSTGDVTVGNNSTNISGFANAPDSGTTINDCYSTGNVATGTGGGNIGGFTSGVVAGASIQSSYTTGNATWGGLIAAGFAGTSVAGTIGADNFYRNTSTSDTSSTAVNANAYPQPTSGWASNVWDLSGDLPTLRGTNDTSLSLEEGLRNGKYSLAREADEFTQDPLTINGDKYQEVDWRATPEIYDELYKGDDVEAENKYDKTISEINSQDKKLQLEQTSVEVEYKAISSERESVKKILDTNAQSSFKYFS